MLKTMFKGLDNGHDYLFFIKILSRHSFPKLRVSFFHLILDSPGIKAKHPEAFNCSLPKSLINEQ